MTSVKKRIVVRRTIAPSTKSRPADARPYSSLETAPDGVLEALAAVDVNHSSSRPVTAAIDERYS